MKKSALTITVWLQVINVAFFALVSNALFAEEHLVKDQKEYRKVVKTLKPGDTIKLANGVWRDFEITFRGEGTKELPITLTAQDKGKVILSGQSSLRLAGKYLLVSGLVFKDGYTPSSSVISFRKSKQELAYYSRVTETVIDNYNNPERFEADYWVAMYGKHNRFDHNHLEGKRNKGVTMAVRLDSEESQENYHRIDHNYFGPRPILGSNGGETLRIGTSHYSRSNSFTRVENNYFDRCDGELEIISNKSGGNIFKGNVFYESRGTLTLRHGHGNVVEENVFFGNGVDHTGGIRVINKKQTIRNNYLEGLMGYRFGGALVVMNGVPNSPINRYDPVEDALIENNTLVNSAHIQLAVGSDVERSAVPVRTQFKNNLIFNENNHDIFTVYDDISGISFKGNILNRVADPKISKGFSSQKVKLKRDKNGLLYPASSSLKGVGASRSLKPVAKEETGTTWYSKSESTSRFGSGKVIKVKPEVKTFVKAINKAKSGDTIRLESGKYQVENILQLDKALTIEATGKVEINFERSTLFELLDGGSLKLKGLTISGASAPDYVNNSVIRTSRYSMLNNYEIEVESCEVSDLDVNRFFNFISVSKSTMADSISITDSRFHNVSGAILSLDKESDDFGIYNAEYVNIEASSFSDVGGALVDLYRGGTDESTFGPHFSLLNSELRNVGRGSKNKSAASIYLHGVQVATIEANQIHASSPIKVMHTVAEPVTQIINNQFVETTKPDVIELHSTKENTALIRNNEFN